MFEKTKAYQIINIKGQKVAKTQVSDANSIEIQISELSDGIYVLNLYLNDKVKSYKFIKN
ncbi:T9SS type A sorting domain-containing protein [Lacihabitans lacunae]|uniref:T9SS type A sorting domain-containing protein n=1 Tax=Lacihabitans lacunae TaxID=1028214 RepID=A0ABV7YVZ6_9BACT